MSETVQHTGHDHAGHDHSGHDHAGHDHSRHDHAGHDPADHSSATHSAPVAEPSADRADRAAGALDAVIAAAPVEMTDEMMDEIEESLRDVVDPELGVNIVDLGLVYDLQLGGDGKLTIDMTLTSAACPLTDMIEDQISAALLGPEAGPEPLVKDFTINWVWLPPWGPERITDDGRDQLRALGFNI